MNYPSDIRRHVELQPLLAQGVGAAGGRLGCHRLVADIPYRLARCSYHPTLPALPTPPTTVLQHPARSKHLAEGVLWVLQYENLGLLKVGGP